MASGNTNTPNTGGVSVGSTIQASSQTREKAESAKAYIENKYAKAKYEEKERKDAWDKLKHQMNQMNLSEQEKELIKQEILHKESENYRL
jgi:serine/threonine kinase 38